MDGYAAVRAGTASAILAEPIHPTSESSLLSSLSSLSNNTGALSTIDASVAPASVPTALKTTYDAAAPTPRGAGASTATFPSAPPPPATPRTAVIFQPACALHRYVRNTDIGTIVERPERLRAVKTGVAAAWARLEERVVAQGGARWAPPSAQEESDADGLDDLLKGLSLTGEAGSSDVKGKGRAREVVGGPFDILDSSALMTLDDPALRLIHPKPNRAPSDDDDWSTASSTPSPPPEPAPLPSSSPSRQTRQASRPSSPVKPALSSSPQPWPAQLQDLCRRSASAILVEPFSEIPPHLPQGDLYLCEESEQAIFGALGAVCEGVDRVVKREEGCSSAFVAIRPPGHHCGEANPQGFCFVNNVAVAAAHAYVQHGINRVIILDIDLHHGNGTQEIIYRINAEAQRILTNRVSKTPTTSPRKSTSPRKASAPPAPPAPEPPRPLQIMYGSLHDIWSYPCEDGDPSLVAAASLRIAGGHGQFISNVHLEPYTDEAHFHGELYPRYREGLHGQAEEFCRLTRGEGGDDADKTLVIVSAGFDASEHESAGMSRHKRNVPTSFYCRFARDAVAFAAKHAGGKILAVLEGGYSDRALASGTAAFLSGLVAPDAGAGEEMDEWWTEPQLKKLEKACAVGKARRGGRAPALVGADAAAEPWLARAVEIFARIEDGATLAPPPPQAREKPSAAAVQAEVSAPRQLRERKVRHNYAGLDDGSTPVPSPTQARRTVSALRGKPDPAAAVEPPPLPPPVPTISAFAPPSTAQTLDDAHDGAAKQTVRFTWKQGGFGGEPRM
ncbi:histone deacetylase [Rhodotorula kratochvilovae]